MNVYILSKVKNKMNIDTFNIKHSQTTKVSTNKTKQKNLHIDDLSEHIRKYNIYCQMKEI